MTNLEKYNQIFLDTFSIEVGSLTGLAYQSVPVWDSVGHMGLMAALEEGFEVMLETDDIIEFSSYEKGKEIFRKYGVNI